ncbi:Phosphatidylglycerolphosphate synthase, partial [Pseudoloma neurophilia]
MENFICQFSTFKNFQINNMAKIRDSESFYKTLLYEFQNASDITVLTLYVGNLSGSEALFSEIRKRIHDGKKTRIIFDYNRNKENSDALEMIEQYGIRDVFYYANQNPLTFLPSLILEFLSVLHIKIYIFDSKVILTGANMDDVYFTSRLDRYFMVEDKKLAQYLRNEIFAKYFLKETAMSEMVNKTNLESTFDEETLFCNSFYKTYVSSVQNRLVLGTAHENTLKTDNDKTALNSSTLKTNNDKKALNSST